MRDRDWHHIAGEANSPIAILIPVNDHHARLSFDQYDWPQTTLENPNLCPFLAAAACIRGFADVTAYLIEKLLFWVAEMLEIASPLLLKRLGPRWWLKTDLARFAPKRKSREKR